MYSKKKNVPDPFPEAIPPELGLQMYTKARRHQITTATMFIMAVVKG
jgi:hypothetical protein